VDTSNLLPNAEGIEFLNCDAAEFGASLADRPSVIVSMFFLQFLGRSERHRMMEVLSGHIAAGATLLISEKVILDNPRLESWIARLHLAEKRVNFSDAEILDKDRELIDCMYPLLESELLRELNGLGSVTKVWQSYSFCGYVVSPRAA
jgi:hypothetical protein